MHIYFIGIGGTGIGPLAIIAKEAGYEVSGSDNKESEYTKYLTQKNIEVNIGQDGEGIKAVNENNPIDWIVSVSAIVRNNPEHPELQFAHANGIEVSERDACLNKILSEKNLHMIAAAGTHGKTTTTAMMVWLFQCLDYPVSYSIGAKTSFAEMGHYSPDSLYFVYECDEFHRNFLNYYPKISAISGVAWDHHEVFPTKENYNQAFRDFFAQSESVFLWDNDAEYMGGVNSEKIAVESSKNPLIEKIRLAGLYNRRNAWMAICAVHKATSAPIDSLISYMSQFPGAQRRMEEITEGIYSDYAHTPEKIVGCLSVAKEIASDKHKKIAVVYEPLTNRRQHYMKEQYSDCFEGAEQIIWLPSYLSREDPDQPILTPAELITYVSTPSNKRTMELSDELWTEIRALVDQDCIVVCMSGGGGNSLDEWLRSKAPMQHR